MSRRDCVVRPAGRSSRCNSSTLAWPVSAGISGVASSGGDLWRSRRVGKSLGQPPGQLRELAPRPTTDAAHAVHLDQREPQQVVNRPDAHPLDRVHGAGAESHGAEQGVETGLLHSP